MKKLTPNTSHRKTHMIRYESLLGGKLYRLYWSAEDCELDETAVVSAVLRLHFEIWCFSL
ncbi:hypothetical protein [Methanobrevibacter sp.]|uniref:hypothetical protein n=1 Tax=Methanobrevibacter sp. TaxID=66852 RepID=UPI00388EABE6